MPLYINYWLIIDIGECEVSNGYCEHDCTNTIGSYKCSCIEGYILNSTNDRSCHGMCNYVLGHNVLLLSATDIDECQIYLPDLCDHYCINTDGSYVCDCEIGYKLSENGHNCTSKIIYNYIQHYKYTCGLGLVCPDCHHYCDFTSKGYNCLCFSGYSLINGTNCTGRC